MFLLVLAPVGEFIQNRDALGIGERLADLGVELVYLCFERPVRAGSQ